MTVTKVAKRAGYTRTTYYNHIENKDLSLDIIDRYGKALGYDFAADIPEIKEVKTFIEKAPKTIEEAIQQRDQWKAKYINILERYYLLLEENLDYLHKK